MLYGDVDQLHVVNKLAGFASGDRAISEVGGALQTADLPPGSCSCHLSGDRYTVYIPRTTLAQGRRIAQLGRGMNIETVTECVETRQVRDRLTEPGIDCAQGFLFGRPKPIDGVLATERGLPAPNPVDPVATVADPTATDVLLPAAR